MLWFGFGVVTLLDMRGKYEKWFVGTVVFGGLYHRTTNNP